MTTTFWYHPESESFYTVDGVITDKDVDNGLAVELDETDWSDRYIEQCIKNRMLPEGISGILVEAKKTLSFGSGSEIIYGLMYLRKGIPDGTETNTSAIIAYKPGNIVRTRNSTYLVKWSNTKDDRKDRKDELEQDARG